MHELEEINALFNQTYNCAQIVCSKFGPSLGITKEDCLRIASGFGAGMSTLQEVCGAVTGAFMVLGLKYGNVQAGDKISKQRTYDMIQEFTRRFKALHHSINCRALLDHDISTPAGLQEARDRKIFQTKCPYFVQDAIEIIRDLIK